MIGFAQMAWKLAQHRTRPSILPAPSPRWCVEYSSPLTPSAEYYRIIDAAEVGYYDTPLGMVTYL